MNLQLFDVDGYPTQEALLEVARFDAVKDVKLFLGLIRSLWRYPDRFVLTDQELYLSTGGWSGNESVISAMEENFFFYIAHSQWKRGGHYWFDLKGFKING